MERINWHVMMPRQRDACIAEKVMGWIPRTAQGQEPWEAALWELPDGSLCLRDDYDGVPLYSRSLDVAMGVVREMNKHIDGSADRYDCFVNELVRVVGSDMFFDLFYCDPASDDQHLTAERLCIAALRACGYEVKA